jgi:hypothetical protein
MRVYVRLVFSSSSMASKVYRVSGESSMSLHYLSVGFKDFKGCLLFNMEHVETTDDKALGC